MVRKTLFRRSDKPLSRPCAGIVGDAAARKRRQATADSPHGKLGAHSAAQVGEGGGAVKDLFEECLRYMPRTKKVSIRRAIPNTERNEERLQASKNARDLMIQRVPQGRPKPE